jgi:hypothetical protein
MKFRQAINETPALSGAWRPGLQALHVHAHITPTETVRRGRSATRRRVFQDPGEVRCP